MSARGHDCGSRARASNFRNWSIPAARMPMIGWLLLASAPLRHADRPCGCPLLGGDRNWPARGQSGATDARRTLDGESRSRAFGPLASLTNKQCDGLSEVLRWRERSAKKRHSIEHTGEPSAAMSGHAISAAMCAERSTYRPDAVMVSRLAGGPPDALRSFAGRRVLLNG
jgi:hypothetical protein